MASQAWWSSDVDRSPGETLEEVPGGDGNPGHSPHPPTHRVVQSTEYYYPISGELSFHVIHREYSFR